MTRYCFDTDIISNTIKPAPDLGLVRRLAAVPAAAQFTTAINAGELVYGAARHGGAGLARRIEEVIQGIATVLPFDTQAGHVYGELRARLEAGGAPLAEPDTRIASIALLHDLVLVTGNVRHFGRVDGLVVENWLADEN